jgi:hypothetical protein
VLERSDETPSLVGVLSSTVKQIEGRIDAAATNGIHWGVTGIDCCLVTLPQLDFKLELLGSRYNVDPTKDEMEALWTRTRRALESLSSGVPPSVARGSPDSAEEL